MDIELAKPKYGIIPAPPPKKPHYCSKPWLGWFRNKGLNDGAMWRCKCGRAYYCFEACDGSLSWREALIKEWKDHGGSE